MSKRKHPKTAPQNLNNLVVTPPAGPQKMGIHWFSNATWAPSGYGVQSRLFVNRLKALGYPMSMTAFYGLQGHTLNMDGVVMFPCGFHPYGMDVAAYNTLASNADICLTNLDSWVCDPAAFNGTRWVPWFPVDSTPLPQAIEMRVRQAYDRIVYTKFACQQCDEKKLDYHYVPMGVDTKALFPIARADAMKELNLHIPHPIDPDKFLISMVAMNKGAPSRKAFYQNIRAFKELHAHHPDTVLYLHTQKGENGELGGLNLPVFVRDLGFTNDDVIFPDQQILINGYPDTFLNAIYNASDVLDACTMGEGFGLPIIEAQSAGCPVIIGDWTSMPELLFSGWKVDKSDTEPYFTFLNSYMFDPHWQAIYEQMELAYAAKGNQELRTQARAGAMAYDADLITEKYWTPVLEKIQARVDADKTRVVTTAAAIQQPREPNDTLLLQCASDNYPGANMLGVTYARNLDYCLAHKIDYQVILGDVGKYTNQVFGHVGWAKIALIREKMQDLKYRNIFYLDVDTMITDLTVDLRDACALDKIGAVWHELKQGGQVMNHYNVGVLTFSNTEKVRKFVDEWLTKFPGTEQFPWWEQGEFNRLGTEQDIIWRLGAEWNSVKHVNPIEKPIITGFHSYLDRYVVMKKHLDQVEKATP